MRHNLNKSGSHNITLNNAYLQNIVHIAQDWLQPQAIYRFSLFKLAMSSSASCGADLIVSVAKPSFC